MTSQLAPTVLIVDDEEPLRRVLERALERRGYRVLSASSAESAYELLASNAPQAVVLDIQLPTMSGLALYIAITNRWPALIGRIAIMTGDAEASEVRAWIARNPCTLLRKPFDLPEIFDWLGSVGDARREQQNG